jgi:uncharacterized metal-binding protein YceD (DUF177 family)
MTKTGSLSLTVSADEIPAGGRSFRIEASEAERRSLAEALSIADVKALSAEIEVRPMGPDAFSVTGRLTASVVQTDVVTLEPVAQAVEEEIDLTMVAAEGRPASSSAPDESGEGEEPELFQNGKIDLGTLTAEHLALGLDPYPRAAGVEFSGHIEDDSPEASPFAALAKLKKDQK